MAKNADPFSNDQRLTDFQDYQLWPQKNHGHMAHPWDERYIYIYLRIFTYICLIFYGKLVGKSTSHPMDAMDAIAISMESTPPQCDGGPSTSPLLRFGTKSTPRDVSQLTETENGEPWNLNTTKAFRFGDMLGFSSGFFVNQGVDPMIVHKISASHQEQNHWSLAAVFCL